MSSKPWVTSSQVANQLNNFVANKGINAVDVKEGGG